MTETSGQTDVLRAEALAAAGRPAEAVALLAQVVAREPENALAWVLLGRYQSDVGEPEEARKAAAQAVVLAPQSSYAHRMLALALLNTHHVDAAWQAAREAVRLAPEGWAEHWVLARVLMSAPGATTPEEIRARAEEALVAVAEAARLAPEEPSPHSLAARLLASLKRDEEAAAAWQRVIALDPADVSARAALTGVRARLGQATLTERVASEAELLADAPQDWTVRHNLDIRLHTLLRRSRWIALGCLVLALPSARTFVADGGPAALPAPPGDRLGVAGLIAAICAVCLLLTRRRLPAGAWLGMRALCRRSWVVRLAPLAAGWCLLCAGAMLLPPWEHRAALQLIAGAGAVPVLVTAYVDRSWRRLRYLAVAGGRVSVREWYGPG